jgi:hypothetical protein
MREEDRNVSLLNSAACTQTICTCLRVFDAFTSFRLCIYTYLYSSHTAVLPLWLDFLRLLPYTTILTKHPISRHSHYNLISNNSSTTWTTSRTTRRHDVRRWVTERIGRAQRERRGLPNHTTTRDDERRKKGPNDGINRRRRLGLP